MGWKIRVSEEADKQFSKLDKGIAKQLVKYLKEKIETLDDPRKAGKPLKGNLRGYWRYRWQDYRIICDLQDEELVILVLKLAHRKEAYD